MADTPQDRTRTAAPKTGPVEIVVVGAGERARAWVAPLRRSLRLRLVATVARGEESAAPDLPRYRSLDEAMRAHPAAAFALALPPRAALEGALQLAEAGRPGLVQAPLHEGLCEAEQGPGAAGVRVAHGWVTLPGLRAVEAIMRRAGRGRLGIEVAGLPEADQGDLGEALVHAMALVRALLPQGRVTAARHAGDGVLEADLVAQGWAATLRVLARGQRLAVRVEGAQGVALWSWERDRESVMLGDTVLVAPRATPAASVRALAQLLPDAGRGDGLVEAAAALRFARDALSFLPTRLPPGARPLRQAASIARRRPSDLLGRLGLRGELPPVTAPPPDVLRLALPPEPFELWAFRAGVKPVAFLTVRPADVEPTLAFFGAAHCERRDRMVQVGAQDCWKDRRDEGEPRVELYIAHDADLARRAAYLQAEVDPTAAMREIGALVGYPPCCVEAFARQDDRANNSRNRYESQARTLAPDGSTHAPWPWELNNLHTMIVPFYPCSYRCERALAWACACLAEMARVHPAVVAALRAALARPVLYFDHDHQLVLDGEYVDGRVSYSAVALTESAPPQLTALAAALRLGNQLSLDDRRLRVERDGRPVLNLTRTDPALGFIAPFGAGNLQ